MRWPGHRSSIGLLGTNQLQKQRPLLPRTAWTLWTRPVFEQARMHVQPAAAHAQLRGKQLNKRRAFRQRRAREVDGGKLVGHFGQRASVGERDAPSVLL